MSDTWHLYEEFSTEFDRDRVRDLAEQDYLVAATVGLSRGAKILDLGCGMGEPIARYLIDRGFSVTGIDAAPSMVALCQERFPDARWINADMRTLDLGEQYDLIIAWDSFFHLEASEQRSMFGIFARHIAPGGRLLFTSGHRAGEAMGDFYGNVLYHASLAPEEYRTLLEHTGFRVLRYRAEDPDCGYHTVWLAQAAD